MEAPCDGAPDAGLLGGTRGGNPDGERHAVKGPDETGGEGDVKRELQDSDEANEECRAPRLPLHEAERRPGFGPCPRGVLGGAFAATVGRRPQP